MTDEFPFEVTVFRDGPGTPQAGNGGAVVSVRGEVDLVSAPALGRALADVLDDDIDHVVVDSAGVAFIDAAGIRVLTDAAERARASGKRVTLRTPSPAVVRILETLDLEELLPVEG